MVRLDPTVLADDGEFAPNPALLALKAEWQAQARGAVYRGLAGKLDDMSWGVQPGTETALVLRELRDWMSSRDIGDD